MAYLLSFVLAYLYLRSAAEKKRVDGLEPAMVDDLAIRIVLGVLVGGRVGYVVQHPEWLLRNPIFLIAIWNGGMAFFGGLAGVLLATWSFAWQHHIKFLALTDVLTMPAALGLGVGRIANFVNGELFGRPTHANWGVIVPALDPLHPAVPRHPSQIYESVSHFLMFGILWLLTRRFWNRDNVGVLSFVFLIVYGIFRLITDFWRADDVYWGPLSDGQWFSLGVAVAGAIALYITLRRRAATHG
jgi:phosphatidylglycerol:prolipoprotein diacylglycerol transferase